MKKSVKKISKKKSVKKSTKKTIVRKKTGKPVSKATAGRKKVKADDDAKAHRAALRAAKKQGRLSAAIGVAVESFSGVLKRVSFPGSRKRAVELPAEAIRTLRSKTTGEVITLIHNGVARLNRLTDRLDFTIRDPRNVQYVRLNTEGIVLG
jgi:hypothetical protein